MVPLPDGSYRFAVSMRDFVGDGEPLPQELVQKLLDERVGNGIRIVELRDAGWGAAQVRVHARVADTFRSGRCLLGGDAAHVYTPLGGQGMNGGIQDAHDLAWQLALVSTRAAPDTLLDAYAFERRSVSRYAIRSTTGQMRLGTVRSRAAGAIRDRATTLLSKAGLLDRRMLPDSVQLRHSYRGSPAVAARRMPGPQGKRIDDVPLREASGSTRLLFDLLREQPYTVLALSAEPGSARELAETLANRYGGRAAVYRVVREGAAGEEATLIDTDGALHERLRAKRPTLCLLRPDAHVAFLGEAPALLAHLDRMLSRARPRVAQAAV